MKVVFVDEDEDQREAYTLLLQSCFPDDVQVVGVEPGRQLGDMRYLVEDPEIATIILDEQLKDSGVAQYFGIELANYLRALNKKIPIYILTSYPESEELQDGELNVEDILNKQNIAQRKDIVGARILRRINSFLEISTDRELRFEELLRKSIAESLNADELRELNELGYLRSAPMELDEILTNEQIKKLDELQEKIEKIEKDLNVDSLEKLQRKMKDSEREFKEK